MATKPTGGVSVALPKARAKYAVHSSYRAGAMSSKSENAAKDNQTPQIH